MKHYKNTKLDVNKHSGYFSFLFAYIASKPFSARIKEIYRYFRKYFLLGRIFRIFIIAYNFIKAGAYFFIIASVFVVLLPLFLILIVISASFTKNKEIKLNRYFCKLSKNRKISLYFFDTPNDLDLISGYDILIAVNKNPTSFVPFLARRIDNNFYIISLRYYYSLKKHIINKRGCNVEVIK